MGRIGKMGKCVVDDSIGVHVRMKCTGIKVGKTENKNGKKNWNARNTHSTQTQRNSRNTVVSRLHLRCRLLRCPQGLHVLVV